MGIEIGMGKRNGNGNGSRNGNRNENGNRNLGPCRLCWHSVCHNLGK